MPSTDFELLPVYLRPKLRLFLSVDLVGSTAFKQKPNYPLKDDEPKSLPGPTWLSPITDFYVDFGWEFSRQWSEFEKSADKNKTPTGAPPEFWKGIGDELVYVKELQEPKEVTTTIWVWMQALRAYRNSLKEKQLSLDVKSTAWIAGFPLNNSEVVFEVKLADEAPEKTSDDPRVSHYQKVEKYYAAGKDRDRYVRDFIGTSIDTGFRLADHSTPRCMMVSIEVVLMVNGVAIEGDDVGAINIFFAGYTDLKGVLGGRPYPLFWIDLFRGLAGQGYPNLKPDELAAEFEDKLLNRHWGQKDDLLQFCRQFIKRHPDHLIRPFIYNCSDNNFRTVPDGYAAKLNGWATKVRQEQQRDKAEIDADEQSNAAKGKVRVPITEVQLLLDTLRKHRLQNENKSKKQSKAVPRKSEKRLHQTKDSLRPKR